MNVVKGIVQGVLIGLANIIPGVSGGTVALVLGIYERFIRALHNVDFRFMAKSFAILSFKRAAWKDWGEELKRIDAGFLACIGTGAIAAIVATADRMEVLLKTHHSASYGFFSGLVLFSMVFPYKHLRRKSWKEVLSFVLAVVAVVALSLSVSDEDKIQKERRKQGIVKTTDDGRQIADMEHNAVVLNPKAIDQSSDESKTDKQEPRTGNKEPRKEHQLFSLDYPGGKRLAFLLLAAGLAISAMVLPGVSGSFVLLLLGAYFDVLHAVKFRQVIVLGVFAAGCLVGLLAFARVMDYLLKKFHDLTMAFMIGLMAGSMWVLWPFTGTEVVGDTTVYLSNQLPASFDKEVVLTLAAFLVGTVIVIVGCVLEKKVDEKKV